MTATSTLEMASAARAQAPATCGELAQGWIAGTDFLTNSPIGLWADVSVSITNGGGVRVATPGIYTKLCAAVERTIERHAPRGAGAIVHVHSAIPRGKGLASSSAELAAGIAAAAAAAGGVASLDEITRLQVEIDRSSDAVHYSGVTRIDHLGGVVLDRFLDPPPLAFLIVDTGGAVETASFDRALARSVARVHEHELTRALALIREGMGRHDAPRVAAGATVSARVNQGVLPKGLLQTLIEGTAEYGGLGVNCAHTGTTLGVMFDPRRTSGTALAARVASLVDASSILGTFPLVSGGIALQARTPTNAAGSLERTSIEPPLIRRTGM